MASTFGQLTVISVQTAFMRSQLVQEGALAGPLNGIISDAAHKFWRAPNTLVMLSSIYCTLLRCWMPALISYMNGASAAHYALHFEALFRSIQDELESQGTMVVADEHLSGVRVQATAIKHPVPTEPFCQVLDFSEAERQGFIMAYVSFREAGENEMTKEELVARAERCLKGCQEHWRKNVKRVAKISAIVPVTEKSSFERRAMALLDAGDSAEFEKGANQLEADYPAIGPWLSWWRRREHAQMLFQTERVMEPHIWEGLPNTTNATESLNNVLYLACGTGHQLLDGLEALRRLSINFFERFEATRSRWPISVLVGVH